MSVRARICLGPLLLVLVAGGPARSTHARDKPAAKPTVAYFLPYTAGETYPCGQGNGGSLSHHTRWARYAWDWTMPVGTVVRAAASGTVVWTKADASGPTGRHEDNNGVAIQHADGNVTEYLHFRKNGVLLKVGQEVLRGDPIGYSGNTGWSTGPHLHYGVRKGSRLGESMPSRLADFPGGVPKAGDDCTSANLALRHMPERAQVKYAVHMHALAAHATCLAAVEDVLAAARALRPRSRPALYTEILAERDDLVARHEAMASERLEAIRAAEAAGDETRACLLAAFAHEDFKTSSVAKELASARSRLRKTDAGKAASKEIAAVRKIRMFVTKAIDAELRVRERVEQQRRRRKPRPVSWKPVLRAYDLAIERLPDAAKPHVQAHRDALAAEHRGR